MTLFSTLVIILFQTDFLHHIRYRLLVITSSLSLDLYVVGNKKMALAKSLNIILALCSKLKNARIKTDRINKNDISVKHLIIGNPYADFYNTSNKYLN